MKLFRSNTTENMELITINSRLGSKLKLFLLTLISILIINMALFFSFNLLF